MLRIIKNCQKCLERRPVLEDGVNQTPKTELKHAKNSLQVRHCVNLKAHACCVCPADKTSEQQAEEEQILQQLIEVVDMRDSLVLFLEEKRLKEISEEQEAFCMREAKRHSKTGAQVHWA